VPGSPRVLLALATPRRYYQPDYYRRIAPRIYGGLARTDPDALLRGSVARFVERPSLRGYLGQLYAVTGWTSLPWLHKLPQPRPSSTATTTRSFRSSTAASSPGSSPTRLHVVRGGGHLFLLERPAETADLVAEFLHGI
jgi:poly(3-hydroxyoctanoate) depolymerase